MEYVKFINAWSSVATRMNARFNEEYFRWNADDMKVDLWEEKIVKEVFDDISRMNPKNIDLSAQEIKRLYWGKYHEMNRQKIMNDERFECKLGLCDGKGLIHATLKKGSLLQGDKLQTIVCPEDYENYIFRCDCTLGISNQSQVMQWKDRRIERVYKIDKDSIYKNSEDIKYNIEPKITYLEKSLGLE